MPVSAVVQMGERLHAEPSDFSKGLPWITPSLGRSDVSESGKKWPKFGGEPPSAPGVPLRGCAFQTATKSFLHRKLHIEALVRLSRSDSALYLNMSTTNSVWMSGA